MGPITKFRIDGLHGYLNYEIEISDNTIILVGENGAGKTSVLRILFYIMSGQLYQLPQYQFSKIILTIDGEEFCITFGDMSKPQRKDSSGRYKSRNAYYREVLNSYLSQNREISPANLYRLSEHLNIPEGFIYEYLADNKVSEKKKYKDKFSQDMDRLTKKISSTILYLPTYRRIEQELSLIFKGFDEDDLRYRRSSRPSGKSSDVYVELVEFGMKDVVRDVEQTREALKDFARETLNNLTLGYLGDVVDHKYQELDAKRLDGVTADTVESILNRVPESILAEEQKSGIRKTISDVQNNGLNEFHEKVICHFFLTLLEFQEELQKKESNISRFCKVCNSYMGKKKFVYNSSEFKFSIIESGRDIQLKHLSSGEKQIVSLFSHLYLSNRQRFFVIIDEPELSLSVPWQRQFLQDIKEGEFCSGLIAATHSPFIYDNSLKKYARGLGEFEV